MFEDDYAYINDSETEKSEMYKLIIREMQQVLSCNDEKYVHVQEAKQIKYSK